MAVPLGGFGKRLNDMHEWHRARGIEPQRGRGRHEDECDYVRWCFADPDIAAAFAAEFGRKLSDHGGDGGDKSSRHDDLPVTLPVLLLREFLGGLGDAGFADDGIINFSAIATLVALSEPLRFARLRHRLVAERSSGGDLRSSSSFFCPFLVRFAFGAAFIGDRLVTVTRFPSSFRRCRESRPVEDAICPCRLRRLATDAAPTTRVHRSCAASVAIPSASAWWLLAVRRVCAACCFALIGDLWLDPVSIDC